MAWIRGLEVRGFRGLAEAEVSGFKDFTLIVGPNGSGTSTLLEAIYLASALAEPVDPIRRVGKPDYLVSRRGGRGDWRSSRWLLWHRGEVEKPMEIVLEVDVGGLRELRFKVYNTDSPLSLETRLDEESAPIVSDLLRGVVLVDDVLSRNPRLVEEYAWPRLLQKRLDKLVVGLLREGLEPEAEGLTYVPGGGSYFLALQTKDTIVRVDDLGDGVRQALLLSMLLLAHNTTTLLLEDPETHMHPGGLAVVMRFIARMARERGFQVIATTHSIEAVGLAVEAAREEGLKPVVYYVERSGGRLEAREFSADDFSVLRRLGIDVRLLNKF